MTTEDDSSVMMHDDNNNNNNDDGQQRETHHEDEEPEDFRETERFKVWRKHTRDVYKTCIHFEPSWPSRTIHFLPFMTTGSAADSSNLMNANNTSSAKNVNNNNNNPSSSAATDSSQHRYHKKQTLLTGSSTSGLEQNYLKLLNLSLPAGSSTKPPFSVPESTMYDKERGEVGGYGYAPEYIDFSVTARFFHDGDVIRARHMPSNPNVYLTASSTGKCYLFDYATISMSTAANKKKRPRLPPAPVMIPGRKEKYERDQAEYKRINKEQEEWDKKTTGEGQHKVVLDPAFSSSGIIPNSAEFNILKPSGLVCAGYNNGAIVQWNLSDPPKDKESNSNNDQHQQPSQGQKSTRFASSAQQKKLELEPSCVRWCGEKNGNSSDDANSSAAAVTEVNFSYLDENVMASSSLDGLARVWDLRANPNDQAQTIFKVSHQAASSSLTNTHQDGAATTTSSSSSSSFGATTTAFSIFEANKLAVGYSDGVIRIWDSRNNKEPIMACANHIKSQKDVTSLQWNPQDKNVLASGGEDGNVVWADIAKQKVMFVHYGHPSGINDMCWCWQDVFAGLMVSVDDRGIIAWSPRANLLE